MHDYLFAIGLCGFRREMQAVLCFPFPFALQNPSPLAVVGSGAHLYSQCGGLPNHSPTRRWSQWHRLTSSP